MENNKHDIIYLIISESDDRYYPNTQFIAAFSDRDTAHRAAKQNHKFHVEPIEVNKYEWAIHQRLHVWQVNIVPDDNSYTAQYKRWAEIDDGFGIVSEGSHDGKRWLAVSVVATTAKDAEEIARNSLGY